MVSYLPDAAAVDQALINMAGALRPGGVLAVDILDLEYGQIRAGTETIGRVCGSGPDWAVITEFATPAPDRFVRDITTSSPTGPRGRRGRERHENVLVDTSLIPARLAGHGVQATVGSAIGHAELPPGLRAVTGRKSISLSRARPGGA